MSSGLYAALVAGEWPLLAPLALMAHCDCRVLRLLRAYIDGVPPDLVSKLLPEKA